MQLLQFSLHAKKPGHPIISIILLLLLHTAVTEKKAYKQFCFPMHLILLSLTFWCKINAHIPSTTS